MVDLGRRNFMRAKQVTSAAPVRLPWVVEEAVFTAGCSQCGDCISACEENIIIKGDGGFPEVNFSLGECTFCQQCVVACEEPLFHSLETTPWQLEISIAASCITTKQVHCQICQDSCEPEAITFTYRHGSVPQPEISKADCTGCGACVAVCPESAIKLSTSSLGVNHE
ncbi:ferredoxin-type protein NapF [Colwellia chukchiensis]|uniref:Ferredoxin-type protein NapF n=1 Tax=Colwellia chukchiensis TaxID=641665 RepID=A0A1H7G464_9GAMM|nr:ferredoxin-type protein NapF [Colwellia chukchiensis]SEK33136.1 ferredoxin-type protein NapF [Colwellia chukchiensis]